MTVRGPLSSYYRWLAERVREGRRETPQRFRPLAWRLAREPGDLVRIWRLYDWLLRSLLSEFRRDPSRPAHLAALVERARVLVEERFSAEEAKALVEEVDALAPRRRGRRRRRGYGAVAPDRVLLVLQFMLPTLESIGRRDSWIAVDDAALAWSIEWALAYYVADYDHDHVVMLGPDVAERFEVIALWCLFNMPGDGLDSLRGERDVQR